MAATLRPQSSSDLYENPFYLHHNDHAGLVLVTDRLSSGADFHSWRRSVRLALNVRNKLGFINGTISKPLESDPTYGSWSRCNDMVATWLLNSVSKPISASLLYMSTAAEIWNSLLNRFKQDDLARIFEIEQRLCLVNQGTRDVSTYYTELVTLWETYMNFVELPVCTCGKCECDAAKNWKIMMDRSRVMKFLMGLNEAYEATKRQVLMIKPLPAIEEVFNMVCQDERQRILKPVTTENVAFQASGVAPDHFAAYSNYKPRPRPVCTHCGAMGHVVNKCFKLHGYPPGYEGYKGNQSGSKPPYTPKTGNSSQRPSGHQSSNPNYNKENAIAHVVNDALVTPNMPTGSTTATPARSSLDLSSFSTEQVQSLISQLHAHANVNGSSASHSSPSITEHGIMAFKATAGTISFLLPTLIFPNTNSPTKIIVFLLFHI